MEHLKPMAAHDHSLPAQDPATQILCATDFSDCACRAADVAVAIAKKRGVPLRLVHSAADWMFSAELPMAELAEQLARKQLDPESRRLRAAGVEVITDLRHGDASSELVAVAGNEPPRLMVIGSTGAGLAKRWLIGSVAERVAENAPLPTLVVRKPEPLLAWLREGKSLRVFCGVDFTVSADAALAAVRDLCGLGRVEFEAAYIARPDDEIAGSRVEMENEATSPVSDEKINLERDVWERLHEALGDMPVEVHVRSASGNTAHEFVRLADERMADLLVIGTHQTQGLRRLRDPSFSRGVLAHASTNVLCVPLKSYTPEFRVPVMRRVLVATDFSALGNEAIRYAYSLVASGGGVRIIHVCPEPSPGVNPLIASAVYFERSVEASRTKANAEKKLAALIPRRLATSGVTSTSAVLVHHDTAGAICEAAERFGADVICMGTRGHSRPTSAILGSVVQRVMALSHKPVFVVTPPRQ